MDSIGSEAELLESLHKRFPYGDKFGIVLVYILCKGLYCPAPFFMELLFTFMQKNGKIENAGRNAGANIRTFT